MDHKEVGKLQEVEQQVQTLNASIEGLRREIQEFEQRVKQEKIDDTTTIPNEIRKKKEELREVERRLASNHNELTKDQTKLMHMRSELGKKQEDWQKTQNILRRLLQEQKQN